MRRVKRSSACVRRSPPNRRRQLQTHSGASPARHTGMISGRASIDRIACQLRYSQYQMYAPHVVAPSSTSFGPGGANKACDAAGAAAACHATSVSMLGIDQRTSAISTPSRPCARVLASPPCDSLMRRRTSFCESA